MRNRIPSEVASFEFPPTGAVFDWRISPVDAVEVTRDSGLGPVAAFGPAVQGSQRMRLLKGQIDLAKKLGCEAAGVWPPPLAAAKEAAEDEIVERLAGCLRPAVRHASDQGLMLAIEGEPPPVIDSPARYKKLFAAVGMKEFKVIFDPSHFDLLTGGKLRPDILLDELGVSRVGYVQFTNGGGTLMKRPDDRGMPLFRWERGPQPFTVLAPESAWEVEVGAVGRLLCAGTVSDRETNQRRYAPRTVGFGPE